MHQAFFNEIKQAGLTASKSGDTAGDYSRGFAAIDTLFKARGGRGDIISLLSRIQTLDGGDINLLAPYGAVNAGAAALTGLAKTPINSASSCSAVATSMLSRPAISWSTVHVYSHSMAAAFSCGRRAAISTPAAAPSRPCRFRRRW